MREDQTLIILKGIDRTKDIESYKELAETILVKFKNKEKEYSYKKENIQIIDKTKEIKIGNNHIYYKGQCLFNPKKAIIFDEFIKIFYQNNCTDLFDRKDIIFNQNSKVSNITSIIDYFKEITKYVKDSDDGKKDYFSNKTFLERI